MKDNITFFKTLIYKRYLCKQYVQMNFIININKNFSITVSENDTYTIYTERKKSRNKQKIQTTHN